MAKPKTRPKKTPKRPVREPLTWDDVQMKFAAQENLGHDKVGDFYPLGRVLRLQHVGPYGFVEYLPPNSGSYHRVYVAGKDTGISRRHIDAALIAALAMGSGETGAGLESLTSATCRVLQRHNI